MNSLQIDKNSDRERELGERRRGQGRRVELFAVNVGVYDKYSKEMRLRNGR